MKFKYSGGERFCGFLCLLFCLIALFPIGIIIFIFGAIEICKKEPA